MSASSFAYSWNILNIFLILCWYVINDHWCYYYNSMKAHIMANIFQQYFLIKACVLIFRHNTTYCTLNRIQYDIKIIFICIEKSKYLCDLLHWDICFILVPGTKPTTFQRVRLYICVCVYMYRQRGGFPGAQLVRNPPVMQETWVQSLACEDPLEKGKATHSSVLAWRIPRTV